MKLIVTIDVEEDAGPDWASPIMPTFRGVTVGIKDRLHPLFDQLGIQPTLLISPIVLQDIESVEVLKGLSNVELGTHLHWEQIAPHPERSLQGGVQQMRHMQRDFPPELEREKLETLTELFQQQFGFRPTSFRAGRYGASAATGAILQELGYEVDTSVTPHIQWTTPDNNLVYYGAVPEQPYYIDFPGNIYAQGDGDLLEVPITILAPDIIPGLRRPPWFRPNHSNRQTLREIVKTVYERNKAGIEQPLVMMFHNVEVIANASPKIKTEDEVRVFLDDMRDALRYAMELGFEPITLTRYAREYKQKTPRKNIEKPPAAPATQRLPRVLFCVDAPMWALDFKSTNLIKNLSPRFEFRKRFHEDIATDDFEWADAVIVYHWRQLLPLLKYVELFPRKVTMGGISCPTDLEGARHDVGMNTLGIFDSVFVHNQLLYDQYKDLFAKPVYLNQNGVDTTFYTPADIRPSGKPLIVGWAGSLENHGTKRGYYDIIVPAVEQTPGVVLHTAAREDKWRGPEEMLEFYRGLDVYLVASRVEGTPNPALEAAACGVPIIATRVGNMPELIKNGENGFLIERTPEAMAARLAQLRDDLPLLHAMRTRIRHDILAWDWSHRAKLYERMINETLVRRRWRP
ncbi:MAG: glycosyltransferase [Alphaproteobacteria bacterium]